MKRLLSYSILGSFLLFGTNSMKADDYDAFVVDYSGDSNIGNRIYSVNTNDGSKKLLTTKVLDGNMWEAGTSFVSASTGEIILTGLNKLHAYNWTNDTWRDIEGLGGKVFEKPASYGVDGSTVQVGSDENDIDVVKDGLNIDGAAVITKNADGSVQIGADGNDIDITAEGLNIDGNPLITQKENGEIHLSLIHI